MSNINTAIRFVSKPGSSRRTLIDRTRTFRRQDNAAFLADVSLRLKEASRKPGPAGAAFDPGGVGCIGLMGEYGLLGYGIRCAQEIIRTDRTPSYWSHAFLVGSGLSEDAETNRSPEHSPWIWESTLEPAARFNRFVDRNGVGPRRLADYAPSGFDLFSPHCVPNIAILAIALTSEERTKILDRADDPDVDQLHYDLSGLLGTWYAYLGDRAQQINPLTQGNAIYCSAYAQLAYDAAGLDLAPGAHQKNTSPEHIWQAFKYLRPAFQIMDPATGVLLQRPMLGFYCVRDRACVVAPVGKKVPRGIRAIVHELESSRNRRRSSEGKRRSRD